MSEEKEPQISMRLTGRGIIPGTIRSRELAAIIDSFEEMVAEVVAEQHSNIKKEDVIVGLASLGEGSIKLGFRSLLPSVVMAAYMTVATAVDKNDFASLPPGSLRAIDKIISFTRRHNCVAELYSSDNDDILASITPTTNTKLSGLVHGQTTIYGRVLRVGGKTPHVTIETAAGTSIYCEVSLELAQELGRNLYEFVEISGMAAWNPNGWRVQEFRIQSFAKSGSRTPTQGMAELRGLVGQFFEDIDDVESYVSSLRSEDESENV